MDMDSGGKGKARTRSAFVEAALRLARGPATRLLLSASESGDVKAARRALRWGADPNGRCESGFTCLQRAAMEARVGCVELLINAGAVAEPTARNGGSALASAAAARSGRCVALLLAAGADPMAVDDAGRSALARAVGAGSAEAVAALIPVSGPLSVEIIVNARAKLGQEVKHHEWRGLSSFPPLPEEGGESGDEFGKEKARIDALLEASALARECAVPGAPQGKGRPWM